MKYLVCFLLSLTLGAACAFGLIYVSPLTGIDAAPVQPVGPQLRYALGGPDLLASSHNEFLSLPVAPANAPLLWESGIRGTWVAALRLMDVRGEPAAIATRLAVPSIRSNAVTGGLITDDHWLITLPGRGTMLAWGQSNVWPILRDTMLGVDLLERDWPGPRRYVALSGPADGAAAVVGLTGEFSGQSGSLREVLQLDDYGGRGFAGLAAVVDLGLDASESPDQLQ